MKYKIMVEETLTREIEIEADSVNEAITKVHDMYRNEEIVLGGDDDCEYDIYQSEE